MDEDWNVDCSDDELKDVRGLWEPNAEEIDRIYSILETGEIPELSWKCPGYRSPSPEPTAQLTENTDDKPTEDKSDFDFMEEMQMTSPKLKVRKDGEEALKGSAKKKTTSLDAVINNMRRHNMLPAQNKDP